jgi:hypothetical protein
LDVENNALMIRCCPLTDKMSDLLKKVASYGVAESN